MNFHAQNTLHEAEVSIEAARNEYTRCNSMTQPGCQALFTGVEQARGTNKIAIERVPQTGHGRKSLFYPGTPLCLGVVRALGFQLTVPLLAGSIGTDRPHHECGRGRCDQR